MWLQKPRRCSRRDQSCRTCLKTRLCIHLLEPPVLIFEFFQAGHQRGIHATELPTLFVKRGGTDAVLSVAFWDWATPFCLLENGDHLAI